MKISARLQREITTAIDKEGLQVAFQLDSMERSGELPIELWRKIRPLFVAATSRSAAKVLALIESNGKSSQE